MYCSRTLPVLCKPLHRASCPHTYNHHRRWYVRLAIPHRTKLLQQVYKSRIVINWLADKRRESQGTVFSFDIEVVLERNRQTMKGSYDLAGSLEMFIERLGLGNCFFEEGIAETIGLMSVRQSFQVSRILCLPVDGLLQRVCKRQSSHPLRSMTLMRSFPESEKLCYP